MERRLLIARDLLKPTCTMFVDIGDDEHHRLRMLLDQGVQRPELHLRCRVAGGRKNDSRYVSNGADYVLVYARNEAAMAAKQIRWREEKEGVHEVLAAGAEVRAEQRSRRKWAALARYADHSGRVRRRLAVIRDSAGDLRALDLTRDGIAGKVAAATNKDLMEALFSSEGMAY